MILVEIGKYVFVLYLGQAPFVLLPVFALVIFERVFVSRKRSDRPVERGHVDLVNVLAVGRR